METYMNSDLGYGTTSKSSIYPVEEVEFEEPLPDELTCDKCHKPAFKAVQTECGHRLCEVCNDALRLQEVPRCPMNEEDCVIIRSTVPDNRVRNKLRQRFVYCVNRKAGCNATIKLKDLEGHRNICAEELVKCTWPGCEIYAPRKKLECHRKECGYRPWSCSECKSDLTENRKVIHESEECSERPIKHCPNCKDDKLYSEKKLLSHLKSCPNKEHFCENTHCAFKGTRSEVDEHEKTQAGYHLNLELQFELTSLQNNYSEKFSAIEERVESIEKANQQQFNTQEAEVSRIERAAESEIAELKKLLDILRGDMEKKLSAMQTDINQLRREHSSALAPTTSTLSRLSDLDFREFPSFESKFVWIIDDFRRKKEDSANGKAPQSMYSAPFYTSRFGYKMCARLYLNGDGSGKGTHISLFFAIMKGPYDNLLPWPFQQEVKLILLAQDRSNNHIKETFLPDPHSNSFRCPTDHMNVASGCPRFVDFTTAKTSRFLKDDTLMFKIEVNRKGLQT